MTDDTWREANGEWLLTEIRRLRHDLGAIGPAAAGHDAESDRAGLERELEERTAAMPAPPALDVLAEVFDLSAFERNILLLCAGTELDGDLASACAGINRTDHHDSATFSLALASLPDPHWDAIAPTSPLRRWHLIDIVDASSLARAPLRIDERVLHYLMGTDYLDPDLGAQLPVVDTHDLAPSLRAEASRIAELWKAGRGRQLIEIHGPWNERTTCVAVAAAESGLRLATMPATAVPTDPAKRARFARRWEREMFLADAVLMVECGAVEPNDHERHAALQTLAEDLEVPVVYAWDGPSPLSHRSNVTRIELTTPPQPRIADLATRLDARASWSDLVLPDAQIETLQAIVRQLRHRTLVHEEWGFADLVNRGLGVAALFSGRNGTGKTMAAEVIANDLGLDLLVVDLSLVINKYIGETENHLRRLFDTAERSGAILLFDEADSLFGKRSDVRDSHDRYANIEVSYLLTRIETFRGLAILTTNRTGGLDEAFLRRLRFVVEFPFPDSAMRERIWRQAFPPGAPVGVVDPVRLAELETSGAEIRNIALGAAFGAAHDGTPIEMHHIAASCRTEFAKTGRTMNVHLEEVPRD